MTAGIASVEMDRSSGGIVGVHANELVRSGRRRIAGD